MRRWIELCSDVNWIDYHGMWARKGGDGAWYVLSWTNLRDAGGSEIADSHGDYECEVKRLALAEVDVRTALRSCGWSLNANGTIDLGSGCELETEHAEQAMVEACIHHGFGAPLEAFTGSKYPLRIRAEARRYAETCMRDAALLAKQLARPVNKIGSTAAEYGRGDIDSALGRGPFDGPKKLMRRMYGVIDEHTFAGVDDDAKEIA